MRLSLSSAGHEKLLFVRHRWYAPESRRDKTAVRMEVLHHKISDERKYSSLRRGMGGRVM